uniref:Uncharacterized protein n=1 Tax=Lygus hesperus TaxID=30085 RepID=A0A0K8T8Y2_LYGHE
MGLFLRLKKTKMLAVPGGGGGLGAERDRQVRLHSVTTDLALDLPPSIPLPDGEEIPYGSSTRLHIRDTDQESEIYQKCIRAPPNRTVFEGEALPPYRASPVPQDWHHLHQHRYPPVQVPPVSVPRSRQRLSALTMVPCLTDSRTPKPSGSPPRDVL